MMKYPQKLNHRFLFVLLVFIILFVPNVHAAFTISQDDNTEYSDARKVVNPPICFYDISLDSSSGILEVCGDHNVPFGPEECRLEVVMRFKAPESVDSFKFATAWCISYKIETNYPVGYAKLQVRYVLYSDDYSGRESHSSGFTITASTPLWGNYDSKEGIRSMNTNHYTTFSFRLQANTWYRIAVQLYIYLDGEANAWSQVGTNNPVSLDVSEMMVYT